jgi:hypothetical protein
VDEMTNFDRWQHYTSGLSSPQNYIDWCWYYIIGAALQRRVWVGPEHQPIFANKYMILVGEPGIGKGLPIREVGTFLRHWKKKEGVKIDPTTLNQVNKSTYNLLQESDEKMIKDNSTNKAIVDPLLYPVAADATTYEALVRAVGESFSRVEYIDDKGKFKVHGHSSLCFILQELASLFRKRTEDTVNFMLGLYDCPIDYEYVTKTQGLSDRVKRGCLNMIAGTTPSFMQSTFDAKLADEGFNSRTFYIYAQRNRKNQFFIPLLTDEQVKDRSILLEHIRQLSGLFGHVRVDDDTMKFLYEWWDDQERNKNKRVNASMKLKAYYSRRNIHVMKMAMALHFGESLEMYIPKETFERAIDVLSREEKNMDLAITLAENNPVAKCSRKVLELLSIQKRTLIDLMIETHSIASKSQLEESLDFLKETHQIEATEQQDEVTESIIIWWKMK